MALRRLAGRLDPVTRGWAIVVAGNVVRLGLGFVASVLLARSLGPADFGRLAVLAAMATVVGAIADLGLTESAVKRLAAAWTPPGTRRRSDALGRRTDDGRRTTDDRRQPSILDSPSSVPGSGPSSSVLRPLSSVLRPPSAWAAFFWLRVVTAGLAVVTVSLLTLPFAPRLLGVSAGLLALALLGVAATALSGTVGVALQATGHYGRLAIITLVNATLTAALAAGFAWTGTLTLVVALLVLGVGTSLLTFLAGLLLLPDGWRLARPHVDELRTEGKALLGFARWLALANLLALLTTQLDLLLVNHWSQPASVGSYALAANLAAKVDIVNHGLYTALLPAASALAGAGAVGQYTRRALLRSALIGLLLLPLVPLAGPFIAFWYGAAYAPAVGLFQLLLAVVLVDVFATPLLLLAYPLNRPAVLAATAAIQLTALALAATWLIPTYGLPGAIAAKLAAKALATGFGLIALRSTRPSRFDGRRTDS